MIEISSNAVKIIEDGNQQRINLKMRKCVEGNEKLKS